MKHSDMPHLFEELKKFETENNLDFIFEDVNEISRESTGGIMKIQKILTGCQVFPEKPSCRSRSSIPSTRQLRRSL
jgi:hypothetical protein